MHRLVLANADELRGLIRSSGRHSPAQRLDLKLHCALLVAEGRSCYEVARWFGESPRTIERWVSTLGHTGILGLQAHGSKGRPVRLTASAQTGLLRDLSLSPAVFGHTAQGWSPKLLLQHLVTGYQVSLSLRQCQRILRRLRATPRP